MSKAAKDIGVCAGIVLFAGLLYWDSLGLKAGNYDPLGSGTMPRMVATAVVVLCLVVVLQALLATPLVRAREDGADRDYPLRPWLAVQIFAFMIGCAVLLQARVSFALTSALFLFLSTMAIRRYRLAGAPAAALFAAACGFGLSHLFGTTFGVDLP